MIRLVLADIRSRSAMWLWTVLCATVGGACGAGAVIAMLTAIGSAQAAGDADMTRASIALGGNIVFFTVLAAVAVVASTVGLTLTTQRREHALWVILGIPRRRVRRVLVTELLVLGLVSGLLALPLAVVVARVALDQWTGTGLDLHGAHVGFEPWYLGATLVAGVVPCLLGGWAAARRASKTPEMRAFRDTTETPARPGAGRSLLALSLFAGVVGMWIPGLGFELGGLEQRTAFAFAGNLFLVCLLLLMGPWVLTPLMGLWTALVPDADIAWRLAVQSCRARAARSVTTVLPFALALSIVGIFMVIGNAMPGGSTGLDDVLVVLGWVFVVSWVGGLAVIALVGRERRRDSALISAAGARPGVIARSTVYEGVVYAVTAILFGAVTLLVSCATIGVGAQTPFGEVVGGLPWPMLAGLAAATLTTTCLALAWPAVRTSRTDAARALRG
ncbi:FtsX-like permease family protein [Prescottella subtropica]|uniref:FtsX-like permease family protein n=1 Tax=Prescottella subtropica TaxID=2545757 RepID=UPI0010F95058|nr:ABC transporter permease [Prescottella subtropica]